MLTKTKHITIKDVADRADVSIQTVSRVINNKPDVSPDTRLRIQVTIQELGYQPFVNARGLAARRTYTLGLVTADFSDFWFSQVITGAEQEAQKHGYCFMLGNSTCDPEDEPKFLKLLTQRHVEGVLFVRASCENEYNHLVRLKEFGIPVVTTGHQIEVPGLAMIDVDNVGGGRIATEYLIGLGHTRIAMITGPVGWKSVYDRSEGYLQALHTVGIPVDQELILDGTWLHRSGYEKTKLLLERNKQFTAIFAQNDRIARGAIHALYEAGLRVPEDVSVIGYDDIPEAEFSDPPLTTIRQPASEIGQAATKLLIQMIEDSSIAPMQIMFDTTIVVRSSCRLIKP
jgi:DNA-binding LacI/PurR family transcriptional regulator